MTHRQHIESTRKMDTKSSIDNKTPQPTSTSNQCKIHLWMRDAQTNPPMPVTNRSTTQLTFWNCENYESGTTRTAAPVDPDPALFRVPAAADATPPPFRAALRQNLVQNLL